MSNHLHLIDLVRMDLHPFLQHRGRTFTTSFVQRQSTSEWQSQDLGSP